MNTRILQIFCTPREGDLLLGLVSSLGQAVRALKNSEVNYILDIYVCLAPELVKWEDSPLSRHFFYDRFLSIKEGIDFAECNFTISEDPTILGPVSHRRHLQNKYPEAQSFTYINPDVIFHPTLLHYIDQFATKLEEEYPEGWVLTPETVRLWDEGWDLLVNKDFRDKELNFCEKHNMVSTLETFYSQPRTPTLELARSPDRPITHPSLGTVPYFHRMKIGWFTTFSSSLLSHFSFPPSSHYGYDEDFFMWALFKGVLKWYKKEEGGLSVKIGMPQYKMLNTLVGEASHKPLLSSDYLQLRFSKGELKEKSKNAASPILDSITAGSFHEKFSSLGALIDLSEVYP